MLRCLICGLAYRSDNQCGKVGAVVERFVADIGYRITETADRERTIPKGTVCNTCDRSRNIDFLTVCIGKCAFCDCCNRQSADRRWNDNPIAFAARIACDNHL